jgi:amino acid permease
MTHDTKPDSAASTTSHAKAATHQSFWLWVMCLTGVDYFSTLGYQPSIAFKAAGRLAPLATIVLVLVTLFCALPVYCHVARKSPNGQGSIAMLEKLLYGWTGKFLVLILLGFAATDFVITKTLSAADAAEHMIHNPAWKNVPDILHSQVLVTMSLLVLLGGMFLRGFGEVILVAVTIVGVYMALNVVVIGSGLWYLARHSELLTAWYYSVAQGDWLIEHTPLSGQGLLAVTAVSLLLFPKLALGLSGFETGVAVMPLIRGDRDDTAERPQGRIRNARRLLLTAAVIMSVMLLGSSWVTTTLIDPSELQEDGGAKNRALAYIAHGESKHLINSWFGETFGTIYDISTVTILWFAGASAMSGLLNLVPRYLPRYGMAPQWAESIRPLVVLFTFVNLFVTWKFDADVEKQGGAYATGVLVLMSSACVAVVIDRWRENSRLGRTDSVVGRVPWRYVAIMLIFLYTTTANIIEKPDGIKIAGAFIVAIVATSLISRTRRNMELRFERFEFVDDSSRVLWDSLKYLEFPVLVPHRPFGHGIAQKEEQIRQEHRLEPSTPIVFVEATLGDPSEFEQSPLIEVTQTEGRFVVRVNRCVSIAHALAKIALELSKSGKPPELHFGWSDESPLIVNLNFVLFGEGNVPWLVRELLLKAEPDESRRPRVIVG